MDNRILKRAGLDYWKHCHLKRHLTFEAIEDLFPTARFLFLSARAQASFFEHKIEPNDILVLGPETTGLTKQFLAKRNKPKILQIPMPGKTRSLNLSTSAGIVVYESLRQLEQLSKMSG
jgi:tRNA (cytidine/uridine-2'-O-)-methyltransferase